MNDFEFPPPPFPCPYCKSEVPLPIKNVEKHLQKQHQETQLLRKYVTCELCGGLFLKHKLTGHMRKDHAGAKPSKGSHSNKKRKK